MSFLNKVNPANFFTKEEISILVFLLFFTFAGIVLKNFNSFFSNSNSNQFEKTHTDSILVAVFSQEKVENIELETKRNSRKELKKKSINLNTATVEELAQLPGIGEKTAMKIAEYRNKYGGFKKLEDLMKIERIGPNLFEKIKDYLIITN